MNRILRPIVNLFPQQALNRPGISDQRRSGRRESAVQEGSPSARRPRLYPQRLPPRRALDRCRQNRSAKGIGPSNPVFVAAHPNAVLCAADREANGNRRNSRSGFSAWPRQEAVWVMRMRYFRCSWEWDCEALPSWKIECSSACGGPAESGRDRRENNFDHGGYSKKPSFRQRAASQAN